MQEVLSFSDLSSPLQACGLEQFSVTTLTRPLSLEVYRSWLEQQMHGEMHYLEQHLEKKADLQQILPQAHSVISIRQPYYPFPEEWKTYPFNNTRVALYARGQDYHHWFKQKLACATAALQEIYPQQQFIAATDSAPILERDFAYQSQLGWIGKNSCLIHPDKGSLFFLGEIITSLKFQTVASSPIHDHCGKCRKCIDACPTSAIHEDRTLNAKKCISYWTIESKSIAPKELRTQMQDWLFGCDICQTVCPWNDKVFSKQLRPQTLSEDQLSSREDLIKDLKWILTASNKQLQKITMGSALSRAGGFGLKRNALIVIANRQLHELRPEVAELKTYTRLAELAEWTLSQLSI